MENYYLEIKLSVIGIYAGFPGGSVGKNPHVNAGDKGLIPGLGRSPGEENGNLLQYSCLENPIDRRTWQGSLRVGHDLATKQQKQQWKAT